MSLNTPRKLEKRDLIRMNLPESLWRATIEKVPKKNKAHIEKYISKIKDAIDRGVGLFVMGSPGVGKSSIAAIIAKNARSIGFSVYFTSFWELRDNIKNNEGFDESETVLYRAKTVDVLILDNLREEDQSEKFYLNMRHIEEIIHYRQNRQKVTIITTSLPVDRINAMSGLVDAAQGLVKIIVEGENQRSKKASELRKEFLG